MKLIIIIPARMDASRFYGKPLELINNCPMIIRIMNQAKSTNLARVVIATPDTQIADVVNKYNGEVVMTSVSCESGTDRVAEAVNIIDPHNEFEVVVNLQGDLAVFDKQVLVSTINTLSKHKNFDISTPCILIKDKYHIDNPNTVKAVISFFSNENCGKVLYFTRSTCPYGKGNLYQHLGIYAYKRQALTKFVNSPKSLLEIRENLEQLRALELGLNIIAVEVYSSPLEVNTKEDLKNIIKALNK